MHPWLSKPHKRTGKRTEYGDAVRVVSLDPEATELLCQMGGEALLVGRSAECDWPPSLARVGVVRPGDLEALRSLAPDVILAAEGAAVSAGAKIVRLAPRSFWDVLDDCLKIGAAVGLEREAERTMVEMREGWWTAVDFVNPYSAHPEVLFLESVDPLFVGGLWTPQLIEAAGGRHSLNAAGNQSRIVTPEEIIEAAPERIVVSPRGCDLARTRAELAVLTEQRWWKVLPALLEGPGRVALVDGSRMFNRAGPRLVDSFRWLTGWLNDRPELISPDFPAEIR